MALTLSSPAFGSGQRIPRKYSCDGEDVSPPLSWTGIPSETKSLALIVEDPDAVVGIWCHWVLFNLPATAENLPENVARIPELTDGTRQGSNSWKRIGYGGPCPPGGTHRYFFRLYALDSSLDIPAGVTSGKISQSMKGHVLGEASLMGLYGRR